MMARSFGAIAQAAAADIHPPGYYWALKLWTLCFGTSVFALRSFSAVAGVLLVLVIAQIGRRSRCQARLRPAGWRCWPRCLRLSIPFKSTIARKRACTCCWLWKRLGCSGRSVVWADNRNEQSDWPWWRPSWAEVAFFVCGVAGLWTHYSFPIVLAAAGIAFVVRWGVTRHRVSQRNSVSRLGRTVKRLFWCDFWCSMG